MRKPPIISLCHGGRGHRSKLQEADSRQIEARMCPEEKQSGSQGLYQVMAQAETSSLRLTEVPAPYIEL